MQSVTTADLEAVGSPFIDQGTAASLAVCQTMIRIGGSTG
jgi:hypothetical protein